MKGRVIRITIQAEGAAFDVDPMGEATRMLHDAGTILQRKGLDRLWARDLLDINGNTAGWIEVMEA